MYVVMLEALFLPEKWGFFVICKETLVVGL
jgi:hypothetical protein